MDEYQSKAKESWGQSIQLTRAARDRSKSPSTKKHYAPAATSYTKN